MDTPVQTEPTVETQVPKNPQIPQPSRDSHWITTASMALFVLMSLGVIVFLYYQNQQLKSMLASYQTPVTSPTPTATADPTANWKTYTNTGQNFSYRCPTEWNLGKNLNYDGKVETSECSIIYSGKFSFDDGGTVTLGFVPNPIAKTQSSYANTEVNSVKTQSNVQTYSNNGFEGWISMKNEAHTLQMIARKNVAGGYYEVTALAVGETKTEQEYKTFFDQILSTFKFVEATPSATPSTTGYTCPANGYVDCMPVLTLEKQAACSAEAMAWYKANCPNFKGGAY